MRGSDQENDGFLCPAGVCLNEHLPHDGNVVFTARARWVSKASIADEPHQDVGTVWPASEALRPPSALCPRPFLAGLIDSAEPTDRQWYRNRKPAVALKACPLDCSAQSLVNPLACWIDTIW
jgi:hypothetical protein